MDRCRCACPPIPPSPPPAAANAANQSAPLRQAERALTSATYAQAHMRHGDATVNPATRLLRGALTVPNPWKCLGIDQLAAKECESERDRGRCSSITVRQQCEFTCRACQRCCLNRCDLCRFGSVIDSTCPYREGNRRRCARQSQDSYQGAVQNLTETLVRALEVDAGEEHGLHASDPTWPNGKGNTPSRQRNSSKGTRSREMPSETDRAAARSAFSRHVRKSLSSGSGQMAYSYHHQPLSSDSGRPLNASQLETGAGAAREWATTGIWSESSLAFTR